MTITADQAIALAATKWWEGRDPRDVALFQLENRLLCMPFDVFHQAIEAALDRPVWTHEMAMGWDGLVAELRGDRGSPSFAAIMELIPADKRIIVESP